MSCWHSLETSLFLSPLGEQFWSCGRNSHPRARKLWEFAANMPSLTKGNNQSSGAALRYRKRCCMMTPILLFQLFSHQWINGKSGILLGLGNISFLLFGSRTLRAFFFFQLVTYLFLFIYFTCNSKLETTMKQLTPSVLWDTLQMTASLELIKSGTRSSQVSDMGQGPKALGHPLLPSQAINRELNQK